MKIIKMYDNEDIDIESYLQNCGINNPKKYLNPDKSCVENCEDYWNIDRGYRLLMSWLEENATKEIYLIQDSDVDGICSASIIYQYLKLIQPNIQINVLFHTGKQHGLNDNILSQIPNDSFVVIPDASINSQQYAQICEYRNIQVLQLDHHDIYIDNGDDCSIVCVNNQFGDITNRALSGAGVTHKFCQYLDKKLHHRYSSRFVDLVALSIVSDSCSLLTYENRAYLHEGFKKIKNKFYQYLCDELIKDGKINPHNLSFNVINVLNAVERSDNQKLKEQLFKCFVEENDDFANVLKDCKKEQRRQNDTVKNIIADAEDNIDIHDNLVIYFTDNESNYTGLVANKLLSKYNKPVFVVHQEDDDYIGSCRSPIEIRQQLEDSQLFNFAAGHPCSFGVSFKSSNLNDILTYFYNEIETKDSSEYKVIADIKSKNSPQKYYNFYEDYDELWGTDIPEPKFHVKMKTNGKNIYELGVSTIKILYGDVQCIKFFCSNEYKKSIHCGEDVELEIELVGTCSWNVWNDKKNKQILIDKMEVREVKKKNIDMEDLW